MNITKEELEQKLENNNLVVVYFWAEWCGPCKVMGPTYKTFKKNNEGVAIHKLEVDEYPEMCRKFGVRNIPTILYFKDGQEVERLVGNVDTQKLQSKLDEHYVGK